MRDGFVPAALSVDMFCRMAGAAMWGAARWVCRRDFDYVLIKMVAVRAMKVTIVEVIGVVAMAYCRVAAPLAVEMRVPFVEFMVVPHKDAFYNKSNTLT
jgi:hypothetical protein